MNETASTEDAHLLRSGTWRDFIPTMPHPVLAVPPKVLYRVLVEGSEFILPVINYAHPVVGFFTVRFVVAKSRPEAETKAQLSVLRDWQRRGFEARTSSLPEVRVNRTEALHDHFRLRSREGFVFYGESSDA